MIPPAPLPPDDSTCWQWWNPPADGILPPGAAKPPTGCDYSPCQNAVCVCDNYCCETAWDLSCRGYYAQVGDGEENNYFVPGCSAKLLCCEPESAFPDPPVGASIASNNAVSIAAPLSNSKVTETSYQCEPGSPGCCETMIPPSYLPPDNSTCWTFFTPPAGGSIGMSKPPVGCDYKPCQDAVCACDPYCCTTAWDLSCRGYDGSQGDSTENNYFVDNCSAKILCCEPTSFNQTSIDGNATLMNDRFIRNGITIKIIFNATKLSTSKSSKAKKSPKLTKSIKLPTIKSKKSSKTNSGKGKGGHSMAMNMTDDWMDY